MIKKLVFLACLGIMTAGLSACEDDPTDACKKLVRCSPDAGRYYFQKSSPSYSSKSACEDDFEDIDIYNFDNPSYINFISCIENSCSELKQVNRMFVDCGDNAECRKKAFERYAPCQDEFKGVKFSLL